MQGDVPRVANLDGPQRGSPFGALVVAAGRRGSPLPTDPASPASKTTRSANKTV